MRIFKFYLPCLIFIFSVGQIQAQSPKTFTHEKEKFLSEVSSFLIDADKKEGKDFVENIFTPVWNDPTAYNDQELEQIYSIADLMLKKRMRAFPDFKNFLYSIAVFPSSSQKENFDVWMKTLNELINSSRKSNFTDYIEMSANLFSDNTFFQSNTTQWRSSKDNFEFVFDSLPKVKFQDINLICLAKGDSSVIYATSGMYYPSLEKFEGREGKVTWQRAGLDENETFAVIQNSYTVNIRSSGFDVDSVLFYNSFFAYPLLGRVEDKLMANVTEEKASYPQFSSYDKRLKIKDIVDKVDYDGGFKMEGASLQGFGTPAQPARLIFYRENVPQLRATSQFYSITPDRISSSDAKIEILINNDSIIHPAIQLRFQKSERLLTLIRTDEGVSKSPYYDSYHKLDLYFEALYWKIDDPIMEMGNLYGSSSTRAAFESSNYYKQNRYEALQGMDRMNPLVQIRNYAKQVNSDEFHAEGLSDNMRYPLQSIIPMLIDLTNKGFISYNISNHHVVVRQRLYDYVMARAGKVDYDVILFNSDIADGKNAQLNLINNDLLLRGVDRIILSDSQNVVIYPHNGEVTLRQNRNFNFGGVINSGKVEFFGKEYAFDYDKFEIELVAVDSCRLYVDEFTTESTGRRRLVRVKNVIEGIAGTLQIDNPFNKSGFQEEFTEYPILNSVNESFVFYDNSRIQGGVYDRNKVHFELEPFILDSLDNFNTDNIYFNGEFQSGGIFPDLAEKLKVQEDYSLGFVRATPADGLPIYGNKAKFTNDIVLNYNGLQGDGALEYLTSTSVSESFVFFPDSTKGITSSFVNLAQSSSTQIPEANAEAVSILFKPAADQLIASVQKQPINMFEGQGTLNTGEITLAPSGLTGGGIMAFSGAELESELFSYKLNSFNADTSDFRLASMTDNALAFKTDNVKAEIDFDARMGKFKSNGDETFVEFPVNEYVCYMDEFKWFMDKNDIALETSKEVASDFVIDTELNLNRSNFFSTNAQQDSLNFMAPKAVYDLDENVITADNIEWIQVADAKILPDSGRVIIRKKAKMDQLTNAEVIANYVTQYHSIYDASITIFSRQEYNGSGTYSYIDENKKENQLRFSDLGVDSTKQTYATGNITEDDNFNLSPHFAFQGKVRMESNTKFLNFDGSTQIIHDCKGLEKNWMKFTAEIDPSEILIPVDTVLFDNKGKSVEAGLNMTQNPYEVYGTFLSSERDESDVNIISSRGFLTYDKNSQTYEISSKEKIREQSIPGSYVSLSTSSCALYGEGELELAEENIGQFGMETIGSLTYNPVEEKAEIHAAMAINFHFNDDAIKKMETYFSAVPDLKPLEVQKSKYEMAIKEIMGLENSDKIISELNLSGGIKKMPEELSTTFFIADVKFTWDPVMESFVSVGEIGIASFLKKQFFRYVKGKIVIEKKASGDIVHIYFENDDENWYYFNYKRGLLQTYSSDKEFNNIIMETKEDKRKLAGDKKEDNYSYMLGSKSKQSSFLDQFLFN